MRPQKRKTSKGHLDRWIGSALREKHSATSSKRNASQTSQNMSMRQRSIVLNDPNHFNEIELAIKYTKCKVNNRSDLCTSEYLYNKVHILGQKLARTRFYSYKMCH